MSVRRREALLAAAFALWGLAVAMSLAPLWERPAPPGQLPGFATANDLDAHAPFRFVAGLIVLTLFFPLLLRPVTRRLASDESRPWARNATVASTIVALWLVVIERAPSMVFLATAAAIAVFVSLRRVALDFTRHDWILLPVLGTTLMALIDVVPSIGVQRAFAGAAALVMAVRIGVALIPSPLPPALAFAIAPLGLVLQTGFFARDQRYFGWHALALVVITPLVLRPLLRNRRRVLTAIAFVVYPLVAYSYINATGLQTAEGKPRLYFFEDSHSLPLASEYLHGERPYRDILPVHGLAEDGGYDWLSFQLRGTAAGNALRTRATVGTLNAVAIYALGALMTGVPEVGLITYFFWNLTGSTLTTRVTPALFTLALIVAAIRKRDPRYLIAAGFGTVVCGVVSLDYALYTLIVLIVAVLRFRPRRTRAIAFAAFGIALAVVPLFAAFATFGILDDFFRGTFLEIPSMGAVYTLTLFERPPTIARTGTFPELLPAVFAGDSFPYIVWCGVAIATAVLIARRRSRRLEPFVVVGLWIVLAAISYAERHHLYFNFATAAMIVPATWLAVRRRAALAPVIVAAVIVASMPTVHIGIVGWVRRLRGPEAGWVEVRNPPRARGALMLANEAATLSSAKKYVDLSLAPHETFFDFTNRAILFYFLRRDNPIRHVETAYYESEEAQREVIATLERSPHVRAALVPLPGGMAVDGVPNQVRAPLVWEYIQQHFEPDFAEGDVVFWRRR